MAQTRAARERHVQLAALPPKVLAHVLGFFRSTKYLGRDVLATPDDWDWDDGTFLEEKTTLKNVLNVARCSRATRDVALGDLVWSPHCAAMEANLPVAPRQFMNPYTFTDTLRMHEEYVDPRELDPQNYASMSTLHRYWSVRGFYESTKQVLKAFADPSSWDDDDKKHLGKLAKFASKRVGKCTKKMCADVAIEYFALKEFMSLGVAGHARDILFFGWPGCEPCCGSSSTAEFLEKLSDW